MIEPEPTRSFPHSRVERALAGISDTRLTGLIALVLFVMAAWPLLLVDLPPLQDLPNHLATAHIIAHPKLYPEFGFNGLFKSNSMLTLWLYVFGGFGLFGAAKAFVAVVLAVTAFALPFFVLRFAGRRGLLVATLFMWPLVHSFSVSMGFLNFSFGFALSLIVLALLDRQRERPAVSRGVGIAVLSMVLWYAHPFPLAVVGALIALHAVTRADWRARSGAFADLLLPLAPAGMLSVLAAWHHLVKAEGATTMAARTYAYLNPFKNLMHLWTDASGAFTPLGSMTLVPWLLMLWFAWKQRHVVRPLLSWPAMAALAVVYVGLPEMLSNWWRLNCRLVPFLWAGLLVRLPGKLPRPLAIGLAACALSFSVATGVDYVRLDRDRAELTAGLDVVPERATLLPLMFKRSKTSEFTASLTHAWGYYTIAKNTSAPLVFAVERSYPITYREFPPHTVIPPSLDRFADTCATPAGACKLLRQFPSDQTCTQLWRGLWAGFWRDAEPRFSHLLTWAMPPETRAIIPASYQRVFAAGDLEIYARRR
jgi:hypothetical protein